MSDAQAIETRIANEAPNATPAFLLCLFLGMIGAHRFYLGRKFSGFLQLLISLTVIGLVVTIPWAIIDLFLIGGICREEREKMRQQLRVDMLTEHHARTSSVKTEPTA